MLTGAGGESIFSQSTTALVFSGDDPSPQRQEGKGEAGLGANLKKPPATGSEESKLPENRPGGDFPPPFQSLHGTLFLESAAQGRVTRDSVSAAGGSSSKNPSNYHLSSLATSAKRLLVQVEEDGD